MSARPTATAAAVARTPAGAPAGAAILERSLDEAARLAPDAIARIALPAPLAPVACLWQLAGDAVLWEARDADHAISGVGIAGAISLGSSEALPLTPSEARSAESRGDRPGSVARFDDVATRGQALLSRTVLVGDGPAARLLGGFSFVRGGASTNSWGPFGDAWFALPRWTYERRGTSAWLVLAIAPAETRDRARIHAEHAAAVTALSTPLAVPHARAEATLDLPIERWTHAIEDIRASIASGKTRKIVAARTRRVELTTAVDAAAVLAELGRRHPECTRFGVRRGTAAFVGASPERLIRRIGDAVDSEALAGSIARTASTSQGPRGGSERAAHGTTGRIGDNAGAATHGAPGRADDDALAAALLASTKDRGEHDWVVRAIESALAPWCAELMVPPEPTVRTLRHVIHLHTPVRGTLFAPRHVLALAAALHPTPAVGGTPTAAALAWIAAHEPSTRGWYAAPVGWFDAAGDGELAVAIRSGLIDGSTATLHAGAGIVRDSDAAAEWSETEVKLRALSGALGLDPP